MGSFHHSILMDQEFNFSGDFVVFFFFLSEDI